MHPVTLLTLLTAVIQNHQPPSLIQSIYSHYSLQLFKPPNPIMNPVTQIILHTAAIQNTNPIMNPVTLITLPTAAIQNTNPIMNPVTLITLPTAAIQNTNPIMNPVTLLTLPNAIIQTTKPHHESSYSNHITHCRYSKHKPPL
jgi:hypothetical protein